MARFEKLGKQSKDQMKTKKEIETQTLEEMRERLIANATENDVYLSAMKRERIVSGNEQKMDVVNNIRSRETNAVQLESDIALVEEKLKEKMNGKV